jgi:hypothetical protein
MLDNTFEDRELEYSLLLGVAVKKGQTVSVTFFAISGSRSLVPL